jgi:hypothetical protein
MTVPLRPPPPQRSQAFFEDFPLCPSPPPIPVQALDDPRALKALFVEDVPLARALVRAAFLATGYARFLRRLPERLDTVLEAAAQIAAIGPTVAATMALVDDPVQQDPFVRAAAMLKACWHMHAAIRAGEFKPDLNKGQPLEMRQYLNLFGTSIVFEHGAFRVSKTADVSHILVLARGKSYVVDFDRNGESSSVRAIADALKAVWTLAAADEPGSSPGMLGTLSSVSLELQTEGFRAGLEDPVNVRSYEAITNTFLTLCLDLEHTPHSYAEAAAAAHSGNCANRWFHASLQLVVFANAKACVIYDFNAGLGGNTMSRAAAEIHRRSLPWSVLRTAGAASEPARIHKVRWNPGALSLDRARADLIQVLDDQQATFELMGHGRAAFASNGLDPVPAFAIAVQLAVLRLTGRFARVRQFISLTKYRGQSVALAEVSTPEMAAVVQALSQPPQPAAVLRRLIEAAIEAQLTQNRQTRSGMSVARSLMLFRVVQTGVRGRYVELVLGNTFKLLSALNLRRMVPTDIALSHPGLFPEVPVMGRPGIRLPYLKGFGLHYLIWDDRITLTIMPSTTWRIPNGALAAELDACLGLIAGVWSGTTETESTSTRSDDTGAVAAKEMHPVAGG